MVDAFCNAVREAGGNCEKAEYPGQHHGFFNQHPGGGNPYFEQTNHDSPWKLKQQ